MSKNNFFSDLPPWSKGIVTVVGVATIGFIVVKAYRSLKKSEGERGSRQELDAAKDDVKKLTSQGQKPTLTEFQLSQMSNNIVTALSGATEDERAVYREMAKLKNDIDVVNLIRAYGSRMIYGFFVWPFPPPASFKGTLGATLTYFFDASEMKALKDMLANKGIKYRF